MSKEKIFKGFPLDDKGCVLGAYPSFSIYSECQKRMEKMIENENEHILKVFTSMNIDPDVLSKQKAEIERLSIENKQLKTRLKTIKKAYKNFQMARGEEELPKAWYKLDDLINKELAE